MISLGGFGVKTNFWEKFDALNTPLTPAQFALACSALALALGVENPGKREPAFESLVEEKAQMSFFEAVKEAHRRLQSMHSSK